MKTRLIMAAFIAAMLFTGCKMESKYTDKYTAVCDFEYDALIASEQTIFTAPFTAQSVIVFYGNTSDGELAGGFGLSSYKDKVIEPDHAFSTPYSVADSCANGGSYGFVIFRQADNKADMPECGISALYATETRTSNLIGFYVDNTNYVANLVRYGNDEIPAFQDGDWMKLTVTGYYNNEVTGTDEIYLADYRNGATTLLTTWTPLATNNINKFSTLEFSITSNRGDFPKYCCIDDVTVYIDIEE